MDEHWHTYWKNPGDSGLGTKLTWTLPEGFTAGPIVWPYPRLIPTPPLASYGYDHQALLLVQITPPAQLAAGEVTLRAKASRLMCMDVCIPGKAEVSLTLPVRNETPVPDPLLGGRVRGSPGRPAGAAGRLDHERPLQRQVDPVAGDLAGRVADRAERCLFLRRQR